MNCCSSAQCNALEDIFDPAYAESELKAYRKKGPSKSTRALLDGLRAVDTVNGRSLLDIGGGVGAIQFALLDTGLARATSVDASRAYLDAAKREAERRGHAERIEQLHGDFVAHAAALGSFDFVTLDRVICCYPDMQSLVRLAAESATRAIAWVSPRDTGWMRAAARALNTVQRLRRHAYRFFVHPDASIEAILAARGLRKHSHRTAGVWQINIWHVA
jgi:tRNA1(Val) A37 N6-methylase TrmN6